MLIAGWLLGLLTVFVWPAVSVERRSYVPSAPQLAPSTLGLLTSRGWVVTRTDTAGQLTVYQLERPRYLAVAEQLEDWWWELTRPWRGAPVGPTPADSAR